MKQKELQSNFILLLAAAIWGFAFVAQRVGVQYVGSFTFNGLRFALGGLSLLPLIIYFSKKNSSDEVKRKMVNPWPAGLIAGCILFTAASLQQIGLEETSAGKAAFITGLYIVLVPILGIFLKQRIHIMAWFGIFVTTVGLYFLSVTGNFSIARSDLLELIGAFFWAIHILTIDHFTKKVDGLKLSAIQCLTCSLLSIVVAVICEKMTSTGIWSALIPILYGGLCSVGIAYTLQILGQKYAQPSHAAIILSMEAVFASIGGLLILNEHLGTRGYLGCLLMLIGMVFSQIPAIWRSNAETMENNCCMISKGNIKSEIKKV